ncbi:MAG: Na/Pi cotransporter family protein [Clostridia bacterium]|nr:Na/Pi cotransporter family protein [Clostridia bacterium]
MDISDFISLLSGIALFLFGMSLMGDGLKRVSGARLEPILFKLSNTLPRGVLLGTGVTAVIQSSCATAVMTVGFVNSGMMKLRQAISVILGAILGTSITGWVICLSYIEGAGGMAELASTATLTGLVAVAGIGLRMFAKKPSLRHVGDIMMGFAVLMFGMSAMSGSVRGLGEAPWFTALLTSMTHPALGILAGALFTALLQSASAAVGIVQALSMTGAITFSAAWPLLMGICVGASAPVLFSAIGANLEGRRTALVYPVATGIGVAFAAAVFYLLNGALGFSFMEQVMDPFSIALANTILRLMITLLLLPLIGLIEAIVRGLAPARAADQQPDPGIRLEERFIEHPALAIEQSRLTINDMAETAEQAINQGLNLLADYSEKGFEDVKALENLVDKYEDSLGTYLMKLTGRELTDKQNDDVSEYLHTLSDFERISDHALNLAGSAQELKEKDVHFSAGAAHELDVLCAAVSQVVSMTVTAFRERDLSLAGRVEPLEAFIDDLCDRMKLNHVTRLQKGVCTIHQGFVFNDIVTNCERVSDHCSNIAVAMIELSGDEFQTHEYLNTLRETETDRFKVAYEEYSKHFAIDEVPQ